MITSVKYADKLQEIINGHVTILDRPVNPEKETVFNVYLNTRKIEVPSGFKKLANKNEHNIETVWFAVDRYFDGQDLTIQKDKRVWAVQFTNAAGETMGVPILLQASESQTTGYEEERPSLYLGWTITHDITKEAGPVTFNLRSYVLGKDGIESDLVTDDVSATIGKALYVSSINNETLNPPSDVLSTLVARIEELLSESGELKVSYGDLSYSSLPTIDDKKIIGELSSADFKNIDYKQILNTPVYKINGEVLEAGGNLELLTEADAALDKTSENPIQNKPVAEKFDAIDLALAAINEELGNMTYVPLTIKSFTHMLNGINNYKGYVEKGTSYTGDCTFAWVLDGNVKTIKIINKSSNQEINVENPSITGENVLTFAGLKDPATYQLIATDPKGNESSAETKIDFIYKIFYGKAPTQDSYTELFLKESLTGELLPSKVTQFNVIANEDEYIYFCLPESYGTPKFSVGGFDGGFDREGEITYTLNNTKYIIWKSTNSNLGDTTVKVV